MSTFEREFRECLEELLSIRPPAPEFDAMLFYRQWLAERNLGLVPIADAAAFAWPGRWLARVRAAKSDHAVVMFGSPSGPLFDPSDAFSRGGTVVEGWLLAPLDLRLPIERPYGGEARIGSVAALLVASNTEAPLVRLDRAVALAGRGLEGDRYHGAGDVQRTRAWLPADPGRGGGA